MLDVVGLAIPVALFVPTITVTRRIVIQRVRAGSMSTRLGALVLVGVLVSPPWWLVSTGTVRVPLLALLWVTLCIAIPSYLGWASLLRTQQPGDKGGPNG